jgi:hypothetical protein
MYHLQKFPLVGEQGMPLHRTCLINKHLDSSTEMQL